MSIKVSDRVWKRSQHAGTELLVLLALADFSNDQGSSFPSVPVLAAMCRMKPRNMNYILKALQGSGELEVRKNEGPHGANIYQIRLDVLGQAHPDADGVQHVAGVQATAGVQHVAPTPATHCSLPLQPIADKPSLNRQEPKIGATAPAAPISLHVAKAKRKSRAADELTFADWECQVRASGEKLIGNYKPVWQYAEELGIPADWIELAWIDFKTDFTTAKSDNRQKDWRLTFHTYVRKGWMRVWETNRATNEFQLTQRGLQLLKEASKKTFAQEAA